MTWNRHACATQARKPPCPLQVVLCAKGQLPFKKLSASAGPVGLLGGAGPALEDLADVLGWSAEHSLLLDVVLCAACDLDSVLDQVHRDDPDLHAAADDEVVEDHAAWGPARLRKLSGVQPGVNLTSDVDVGAVVGNPRDRAVNLLALDFGKLVDRELPNQLRVHLVADHCELELHCLLVHMRHPHLDLFAGLKQVAWRVHELGGDVGNVHKPIALSSNVDVRPKRFDVANSPKVLLSWFQDSMGFVILRFHGGGAQPPSGSAPFDLKVAVAHLNEREARRDVKLGHVSLDWESTPTAGTPDSENEVAGDSQHANRHTAKQQTVRATIWKVGDW
eukprot:CAMPEP_0202810772 /NCGR_PEP_ID=MMETSP1389-20130828/2791_1 /ASSEMBLY_ACC=CAM_ASM_000865 /TAXON_ID=302021 /ORGANISM="Rhodomonas sp., Strain CCMP768" /LENGTH=333 /DNA_ID=CAMNT_0049481729 /DNA_START=50 /DNA_END=1050 /DNA_ORIENTATION=-